MAIGTMSKVLLIDDDHELASMLTEYLGPDGWTLDHCATGDSGLDAAVSKEHHIIVLDVMLPGLSGFDILQRLRQQGVSTPVLMLTARGDDVDRIVGLELGADDYLPKPFNPRELSARLKAILRRSRDPSETNLTTDRWSLDTGRHEILEDGVPLPLTGAEYRLMEALMRHQGEIVSRERLTEMALGRKLLPLDRSLDTHISNLRKKLSRPNGQSPIRSVRGEGYMLVTGNHP